MVNELLVLSLFDPWHELHGGAVRTRAIVHAAVRAGCTVTVVYTTADPTPPPPVDNVVNVPVPTPPLDDTNISRFRAVKRRYLPMPTAAGARNRELTAAVAGIRRPEVIVISQLSAVAYTDQFPAARLWMDYSDVWSEFARREADQRRGLSRFTSLAQRRAILRSEARVNGRAAIVTAAGWRDTEILRERGRADARWLPTPIAVPTLETRQRPDRAPVAGFIGNFAFPPNADAFACLRDDWGPRLVAAGWDIVIAGPGSDTVSAPTWIRALGPVESVGAFYGEIDLALAPVRLGGGMKVKVVEALTHGIPVVASSFALDGFPPDIRELASVCEVGDPRFEFSRALLSMHVDTPARLRPFTAAAFDAAVAEDLDALD